MGGPGELQIELDKRIINTRIKKIKFDLKKIINTRTLHRKKRKGAFPIVSIIGYTNTGKSIAPLLAQITNAGLITNAIDYPENLNPLTIKCKAFSSKAYAKYESNYEKN